MSDNSTILVLGFLAATAFDAGLAAEPTSMFADQQVVAAQVDGEPIYADEVARLLEKATRGQKINPEALPTLQAQVLGEIVDRRLVLAYARHTKSSPSQAEIDKGLAELKAKLASQNSSLPVYLKSQSITESDLRRQIAWNLIWEKYLSRYATNARVESYFNAHRRQFDGSEISASHILLQPPRGSPQATADLVKRAQAIRQEIAAGKISFAEAARKHSAGPSAAKGGALGFVARHGSMAESFSRAAFSLEAGQVSEPVLTPFGVHLIRCDEIKPGKRPLADVRQQVEEALARELLDKIARQQQEFTPVEFTGKSPYFKPDTRELVVPKGP